MSKQSKVSKVIISLIVTVVSVVFYSVYFTIFGVFIGDSLPNWNEFYSYSLAGWGGEVVGKPSVDRVK